MSSRLDSFFSVLWLQLNEQGMSYRMVCKFLRLQGVEISPQALRSWHVRRMRKIAQRVIAMPPVLSKYTTNVNGLNSTIGLPPAPAKDLQKPVAKCAAVRILGRGSSLQEQIQMEEQKLLQTLAATGVSGYLIPKGRYAKLEPSNQIESKSLPTGNIRKAPRE